MKVCTTRRVESFSTLDIEPHATLIVPPQKRIEYPPPSPRTPTQFATTPTQPYEKKKKTRNTTMKSQRYWVITPLGVPKTPSLY